MNIRPLHDRALVKRLAAEGRTSGGLSIPDTAKEKPLELASRRAMSWERSGSPTRVSSRSDAPRRPREYVSPL
jgi:hypothetical protein